jgi:hypothetical protein
MRSFVVAIHASKETERRISIWGSARTYLASGDVALGRCNLLLAVVPAAVNVALTQGFYLGHLRRQCDR